MIVEVSLFVDKLTLTTVLMDLRTQCFALKWVHLFGSMTQPPSMKTLHIESNRTTKPLSHPTRGDVWKQMFQPSASAVARDIIAYHNTS